MSEECCSSAAKKATAAVIGVVGTLLVLGALAVYLVRANRSAPIGTARAEERKKAWTDLQNVNADVLNNYGVVKAENGTYRLPVAKAMEVMAAEWKDGNAAGRAKLLQRLEASLKQPSYE
jgi:hypothetical protein